MRSNERNFVSRTEILRITTHIRNNITLDWPDPYVLKSFITLYLHFFFFVKTYIHKLTPFSNGGCQKQNATCYVPYILLSPRPHSYIIHARTLRVLRTCPYWRTLPIRSMYVLLGHPLLALPLNVFKTFEKYTIWVKYPFTFVQKTDPSCKTGSGESSHTHFSKWTAGP